MKVYKVIYKLDKKNKLCKIISKEELVGIEISDKLEEDSLQNYNMMTGTKDGLYIEVFDGKICGVINSVNEDLVTVFMSEDYLYYTLISLELNGEKYNI